MYRYYDKSDQLYNQARAYQQKNDLEHAYMSYLNTAQLLVKTIPHHLEYDSSKYQREKRLSRRKAEICMDQIAAIEVK